MMVEVTILSLAESHRLRHVFRRGKSEGSKIDDDDGVGAYQSLARFVEAG